MHTHLGHLGCQLALSTFPTKFGSCTGPDNLILLNNSADYQTSHRLPFLFMPDTVFIFHVFFISLVLNGWASPDSLIYAYLPALDQYHVIIKILAISADLVILN